jgi:hypothetical protein
MLEFLQIFFLQPAIQRTIVEFPAFFGDWFGGKISVCVHVHTTRVPNKKEDSAFLYEAAKNFEVFSNILN